MGDYKVWHKVELSIKIPSWGCLTRRIWKHMREASVSTCGGLFVTAGQHKKTI